jgi:integrase
VLREHKLASKFAKSPDLVFCNGSGNAENLGNIVNRGLHPAWVAARVVNESGKSKYTGMHVLRHFFASWMISPSSSGGLNISLKEAQTRLGHSSIMMTADVYGHLMPRLGTDRASNETATRLFST